MAEGDRVRLTPLPDDPVKAFCGIFTGKVKDDWRAITLTVDKAEKIIR